MNSLIPTQIIDFHVHLFPDPLFDAIWKFFSEQYKWQIIHNKYSQESIDYLKNKGVSRIIYSNYAHKKGVAKALNEWNIDTLNRNENLYCFAAFHPDDEDCLQMAKSVLDHPRVIGFKLQHLVQDFFPADERLFPLYEAVMEKNKRILFHVGTGPVANKYVGYKNFIPLLHRYPQLPANVAHLGGHEFKLFFDLLKDHKNMMMDTSFCFFRNGELSFNLSPEYLESNKDRLLYGSDFPNLIFPRSEEIETLAELKLSNAFYQQVFWDNGKRLLDKHCPLN
ncbi:MAG: amidohydrolase family protein [Deltaproteobacteria bacterium]|nr:amidohydrolase family protein [Deltaproteobacteria bacterium]MBT4267040.1 amidohydrolase family protein [Deltaproteobacteria bacterium]MBT4641923.1 amidohydrolase family protein [Deltaproteobacteria bacterium]MBT6615116.1 amidohydrolase family protein [Deltaproteobacteria bacterium]